MKNSLIIDSKRILSTQYTKTFILYIKGICSKNIVPSNSTHKSTLIN